MTKLANSMPASAPSRHSAKLSASTSHITCVSLKPRHFNTASSGMRSRTACDMATPVRKRMEKNTAPVIRLTIRPMSPSWRMKPSWNSCSLCVLVSSEELANFASMVLAMRSLSPGSATCTTNTPARPRACGTRPSSNWP